MNRHEKPEVLLSGLAGGTLAIVIDGFRVMGRENSRDQVNTNISAEQHYETEIQGLMVTAVKDDQPAAQPFLQEELTGAQSKVQILRAERPPFSATQEYSIMTGWFVAGAVCAAGIARTAQKLRTPKDSLQSQRPRSRWIR